MKKLNSISMMHRWLCTIMLLFVGMMSAMATNTYYYKTTVNASPTAGGKVYVSASSTDNPAYQTAPQSISGGQRNVGNGTLTFYFYAQANENYIFDHWAQGSANGTQVGTAGRPSYSVSLDFSSTSQNSPTTFTYYAVFKAQTGLIKVKSKDESKGSVTISNSENKEGDEVILTATPDVSNGVMFLGWKKNDTGDYISTDNPLTLTADNDTKGTYYAYFSEPAEKVYIRLKNKKTGRFLSIFGNAAVVSHTRDLEYQGTTYRNTKDGFIFTNSLKMISATDAQGNPSTVFMRTGHASGTGTTTGVDLVAHKVNYSGLVGANLQNNEYMLNIEDLGSYVRIYTTYTVSVNHWSGTKKLDMPTYLSDEGDDYAVMKTIAGLSANETEAAEWYLYALDETTTEGAFGANAKAKFTKDDMYYTTMYTDFAYKLLDGVNAYYLVFNPEFTEITDRVVFTKVEGGIVPANTAVILECQDVQNDASSTNVVNNRLVPLVNDNTTIITPTNETLTPGLNLLKGYIYVNGSRDENYNKIVTNDHDRMYILGFNQRLGFYHSSSDNMTPYKAYLLAPEASKEETETYAKKLTFSFGEPKTPTEIVLSDLIVDDEDAPVFDLNGRKVAEGKDAERMLRQGIYVKKGKKFVVK
jgi:hypothetical protein